MMSASPSVNRLMMARPFRAAATAMTAGDGEAEFGSSPVGDRPIEASGPARWPMIVAKADGEAERQDANRAESGTKQDWPSSALVAEQADEGGHHHEPQHPGEVLPAAGRPDVSTSSGMARLWADDLGQTQPDAAGLRATAPPHAARPPDVMRPATVLMATPGDPELGQARPTVPQSSSRLPTKVMRLTMRSRTHGLAGVARERGG